MLINITPSQLLSSIPVPITIINWNGLHDTLECIDSVLKLKNITYEIHLWDNASENNEYEILKNKYSRYNNFYIYKSNKNIGFTKASNRLYEILTQRDTPYEYIALLNNDTVVDKYWLYNLLKEALLKRIDLVSSKMVQYYNRNLIDNTGHFMLNTGEIMPIGHNSLILNDSHKINHFGPCAGAALYSMSMLMNIGFFDEHFDTGYEDAEFGLRAIVLGYNTTYCPNAIIYHKMGSSIKKIFNLEYTIKIQTSILYSYFKLIPISNFIISLPSFLVKYLIMFIVNIIFWRPKFIYISYISWIRLFGLIEQLKVERNKIRGLQENKISTFKLSNKLSLFLWTDIIRFWNILILKKNNSIDQYGSHS